MLKILLLLLITVPNFSQIDPVQLLKLVDSKQRDYSTLKFVAEMKIESGSRTLIKSFIGSLQTVQDKENSFMEYTNPQDRGTKYLKLDKDLWIYLPDAQDVMKISGHLLRDSMMGSDISYDDMLDQGAYAKKYTPESVTSTNLEGQSSQMLRLKAKENTVSYVQLDMFIDPSSSLIQKIVMYAKGRKEPRAIKEFSMSGYKIFNGMSIATVLVAKDLRKKNSQTTITYTDLEINPTLDPKIFTRINLER